MRVLGDSAGNAYTRMIGSSTTTHQISGFFSVLTQPLPAGATLNLDLNGLGSSAGDAFAACVTAFSGWTAIDQPEPDTPFGAGRARP